MTHTITRRRLAGRDAGARVSLDINFDRSRASQGLHILTPWQMEPRRDALPAARASSYHL